MTRPIILHRYTTKDGIVGPIEARDFGGCWEVLRSCRYDYKTYAPDEEIDNLEIELRMETRCYRVKKRTPAILMELEEY